MQNKCDAAAKDRALRTFKEQWQRGVTVKLLGRATAVWTGFVDEQTANKVNIWLAPINTQATHKAATATRHG